MIHERDDHYEGQDDGEYHFSDDQANYEMEPDLTIKSPEAAAVSAPQETATKAAGAQSFKRPLIGLGVFFVLIFLVYKILAPSASPPVAEFSQGATKIPVAPRPVMEVAKSQPANVETIPAPPPAVEPVVASPPPVVQAPPAPAPVVAPAPAPVVAAPPVVAPAPAAPTPAPMPQVQTPPPAAAMPVQQPAQPMQAAQPAMMQPTTVVPTEMQPPANVAQPDSTMQSAKLLQTTQKLTDLETQNTALQGKVQDMSMRLASMEATIARLGKIIQESRGAARSEAPSAAPAQPARPMMQPRSNYSVQAIIPGRAWLKSDSGDTVTVAEGDVIRDFGRVMKIDPYDGIVEIDAAGRTITLSYGINGD